MDPLAVYPRSIPSSEDGLRALHKVLIRWSQSADEQALVGQNLRLGQPYDVQINKIAYTRVRADHPTCEGLCKHFIWPARRSKFDVDCHSVRIGQLLTPDAEHHTRAYEGTMALLQNPQSRVDVVVKIYQGSLADFEQLTYTSAYDWKELLLGYQTEAWAYKQMADLQGTIIPHIYGFFEVRLPANDERAIATILESVPDVPEVYHGKGSDLMFNLAYGMMAAAHAVNNCSVQLADFAKRNTIWTKATVECNTSPKIFDSAVPVPVLIDFEQAEGATRTEDECKFHTLFGLMKSLRADYTFKSNTAYRRWWKTVLKEDSVTAQLFDVKNSTIASIFEDIFQDIPRKASRKRRSSRVAAV